MSIFENFEKKLQAEPKSIVFTEGTDARILSAASRLLAGKTVLVIAHRMRTVEAADKIVVLADGRVAEEGSPAELMAKGGLYRRMVELQQQSAQWSLE